MGDELQAKGVAFVGILEAAKRAPGGLDAVRARLSPYFRERLEPFYTAHSWYPLDELIALMRAVAQVRGADPQELVRDQAARAARQDVEGLYRQVLRSTTPREMSARLPRAFNRYFRPMRAELVANAQRWMEVEIGPVPATHAEFFRAINEGFVGGALETVGARSVRFEWVPPEARRASIRFVARW